LLGQARRGPKRAVGGLGGRGVQEQQDLEDVEHKAMIAVLTSENLAVKLWPMSEPAPVKLDVTDQEAAFLERALKIEGFFPEFTKDQVRGVCPHGGLFQYPQGFRLINQGEEGRDLFVIHTGKVEVIRAFVQKQIFLGSGEMFGEMAIVRDGKRNATVIAAEESKIFHLPFSDLQYLMDKTTALTEHFKALAYHRL